MHIERNDTNSHTDNAVRAYKRPVLRKRHIRSLRRLNHGLSS